MSAVNSMSLYKTPAGAQAVAELYAAALAHWPVPHTTQHVPTRHGDTFVIASGSPTAPPLLLLHGAGGNSSMWAGDVAAYSQHYRVYAVDLLGEAGQSSPNRPEWRGAAFSEWLEDVLDALQIERATFVGISQGAWAALKLAVSRPERVERLVLLTPGGIVPDKRSFLVRAVALTLLGRRGRRMLIKNLFGDQAVPAEVTAALEQMMSVFKPRIGTLPLFSDNALARLRMPILLLGGSKDSMRNLAAITARLQACAPAVSATLIPGAGHALINTTPLVLEFLLQPAA